MLHPQRTSQRGVGLNDNVMRLAEGSDLGACIERVHFDLVDGRVYSGLGGEQFLQLECPRENKFGHRDGHSYMLYSIIAHSSSLHLSVFNGILNRFPRFQPLAFASIWTMKEEQVDVS